MKWRDDGFYDSLQWLPQEAEVEGFAMALTVPPMLTSLKIYGQTTKEEFVQDEPRMSQNFNPFAGRVQKNYPK